MVNLDFMINEPVDYAGRPFRINTFFKEANSQNSEGFYEAVKKLNRDLGLSNKSFRE